MRKLRVLSLVFLSVLMLFNCGPIEETTENGTTGNLAGSWRLVRMNYTGNNVAVDQTGTIRNDYSGKGTNINATATFSKNPNEMIFFGSYDIEFSYDLFGQETLQTISLNNVSSSGTWNRNDIFLEMESEMLSISNPTGGLMQCDAGLTTYTIEELTDRVLRLSGTMEYDVSQPSSTISAITTTNLFYIRD